MANWDILKAAVAEIITTNGNQEITGALLQSTLLSIVNNIGENATFAGIATPGTNPSVPDGPVFYLATDAGIYPNFNNTEVFEGEAVIFHWDNGIWYKKTSGFATQEQLLLRLQGRSDNSDASIDPHKFLGEFGDPNGKELQTALDNLHSTNQADGYEGVWRFTVRGKPATLYNFSMSYTGNRWVQGLISVYGPNSNPDYVFGIDNKVHVLYRSFDGSQWSKWRDATQDNKDLITQETARATAVEEQLWTMVNAEASRATSVEAQLFATRKAKRNFLMVDGETATIISKYNRYWDIVIRFTKVMANELYSIDKVFLAENHNNDVSSEVSDKQYLLCGQTTSDMIGPVMVTRPTSGNSWVGGNHLYLNQQSGVKSACTKNYSIFADDVLIEHGSVYADVVTIFVENTIFDPDVAPSSGETMLSSPLISESVSYRIDSGEILVGVEHRYLKDVTVKTYYGMQSMFLPRKDEAGKTVNVQFITAHGNYYDWTVQPTGSDGVYIKKKDAPDFNRFSQKHENGHYQNTVLLPYGLGNHDYATDNVFVYSGNKAYHVLIQDKEVKSESRFLWTGVYNWKRPMVDDEFNYIYDYSDINKRSVSVIAKKAYTDVLVPAPPYAANTLLNLIEDDVNISVDKVVVKNFNLSASNKGAILCFFGNGSMQYLTSDDIHHVKIVTEVEYNNMKDKNELRDDTLYHIVEED